MNEMNRTVWHGNKRDEREQNGLEWDEEKRIEEKWVRVKRLPERAAILFHLYAPNHTSPSKWI